MWSLAPEGGGGGEELMNQGTASMFVIVIDEPSRTSEGIFQLGSKNSLNASKKTVQQIAKFTL
jgi:hypothetical protein